MLLQNYPIDTHCGNARDATQRRTCFERRFSASLYVESAAAICVSRAANYY